MRRINGIALIVIGLLHSLALIIPGAIGFPGIWNEISQNGFIDVVSGGNLRIWGYYWFLIPGFALMILGIICTWVERRLSRPLPAFFGWSLLAFSVFGIALDTDTGFWLVLLVAINIIVSSKRRPDATA